MKGGANCPPLVTGNDVAGHTVPVGYWALGRGGGKMSQRLHGSDKGPSLPCPASAFPGDFLSQVGFDMQTGPGKSSMANAMGTGTEAAGHAESPANPIDQCVQQEMGQPPGCSWLVLPGLQFRASAWYIDEER
jgi:hypothetical protein